MEIKYPFEIEEIDPVYKTEEDAQQCFERLVSELLAILDDA